MHERQVQSSVNRRLSGLDASPARRARIRAALHTKGMEVSPVKRKLSSALVFALILVLLMISLAIADNLNLFGFFGQSDTRYAGVADVSTPVSASPASVTDAHLGQAEAVIDSVYFDGLSFSLAFRIRNSTCCEVFTPTAEELASMQHISMPLHDVIPGQPGEEIVMAFNRAVENGTPFGYRHYSIYSSDHVLTDDGIDIPLFRATNAYDEKGDWCELRESDAALPAALRDRDSLAVTIRLYQSETLYYFDGKDCWYLSNRQDAGSFTATADKTDEQVRRYAGEGTIHGVSCRVTAEIGRIAGAIQIDCDAPLNSFLPHEPGSDSSFWITLQVTDQSGSKLRQTGSRSLDDSTVFSTGLYASAALPERLTVSMYAEGMDRTVDLSALDSITLLPVP